MKLYKTKKAILLEKAGQFFEVKGQDWDLFINDDNLFSKLLNIAGNTATVVWQADAELIAPIGQQEVWACGVTYLRSKLGRQEESQDAGGGDFYAKVYEAERPEVFFKSNPHRIVGHKAFVRIRKDSTWDVPEPELTLVVTSSGKIIGYTIGNDMSSRIADGKNVTKYEILDHQQWHNFAPRLSFAWDPKGDSKTSIRGGFGMFYDFMPSQLYGGAHYTPPIFVLT